MGCQVLLYNITPGVYPPEDTGEVEKQRIDSAALHRISCSCVGALLSVALFCCIFNFGTFFGFIRVYTVIFSDPPLFLILFRLLCECDLIAIKKLEIGVGILIRVERE